MDTPVYDPQEDSFLLKEEVEKHSRGIVLDMGTGSGIQAAAAAKRAKRVYAVDINPLALNAAKLECDINKAENVTFLLSDLFENVPKIEFDVIIFNPPYLPDEGINDPALFGGKHGYETLVRFLEKVADYLADDGKVLITSSSLTIRKKIMEKVDEKLLVMATLRKEHYFFEDLYVDLLKKSPTLKELSRRKICSIKYFDKGKRGIIYTGRYKRMKVGIKVKRPDTHSIISIENEAHFLEKLNRHKIGPKYLFKGDNFIVYKFVEGVRVLEFLDGCSKSEAKGLFLRIFTQLCVMDKLKVNKFEMNHPVKHILINKMNQPTLIDFERCRFVQSPKNVTQFCDFLCSSKVKEILTKKGLELSDNLLLEAAKKYKESYSDSHYRDITNLITKV